MAKAYSLAWFVVLGALPMIIMVVLYSKVIYSLWIKQEQRNQGAQKVFVIHLYSNFTVQLQNMTSIYSHICLFKVSVTG